MPRGTLRQNLIFFFFISFGAIITWRLINLQIIQGDFYKALAEGQNNLGKEIRKDRGEIFLRDFEPLAINKDYYLVFGTGPKIVDPEKTAQSLSSVLDLPEEFILEKISKDTLYSPIKDLLSKEEIMDIKNLNLPGINFTQERNHYFPQEALASQVIGFVDADYRGQYGLEEHYNDFLSQNSSNLVLTIDYDVQFMAEKLLNEAKKDVKIESGSIVVMDPNSGKILAMANFPNFNPNEYREYAKTGNLGIFQNNLTQKIFEPGSVLKPITMAAALEEEAITPQTTYTDEGVLKIGGRTVYNYDNRVYGEQTMTQVLEKSINTGAVFAERELGHNLFLKYIDKFGFFSQTGIDLPEIYSENREFKKGYEINYATAAFGQGIEITPIQLVRAFSAIANGGRLVKPYLAEKIGQDIAKPEYSEQVISSKTASEVTTMLTSVVENGFSKKAKIPGYYVAGKTGTAQVPEAGKYSLDKTVQSFIGFFPAFSPKFLILVKLDNPQTKTAEYSALPIFHDLAEYVLRLYQVPPDYSEEK